MNHIFFAHTSIVLHNMQVYIITMPLKIIPKSAADHPGVLTSQHLTHDQHENIMVHVPYKRHIYPLPPLPHYHTPQVYTAYKHVCVSYKIHLETFPD